MKAAGMTYEKNIYDPVANGFITAADYEKLIAEDPAKIIVAFNHARVQWMPHWLRMPHMTVGSDAMWSGLDWDHGVT